MPQLGYGVYQVSKDECELKVDYIDLVLLHQPFSDYYGAWRALEDMYADGKIRATWGTLCEMDTVALYLSAGHKTVENIRAKKAFTVAVADEKHMVAADYVGLVSAHTEKKKMEKSGFTVTKSARVDAPVIEELPLTFECELDYIDGQSGCVYGRVINVLADEKVLDGSGNVDLCKLNPISYDPASRSYFTMGIKVGAAFSIGAKLK